MKYVMMYIFMCVLLIFCVGCQKAIHFAESYIYQGRKKNSCCNIPEHSVRTIRVYDQFDTVGWFDVVRVSPEIIEWMHKMVSDGYRNDAFIYHELRALSEKGETFLVLSLYDQRLTDCDTQWSLLLKIHEVIYRPFILQEIQMCRLYQDLFGERYVRAKNAYMVTFPVQSSMVEEKVTLIFSSPCKEGIIPWNIHTLCDSSTNLCGPLLWY